MFRRIVLFFVMPGLVPGIPESAPMIRKLRVDGRVRPGHDD
jgi:hypothetical protein